MMRRKPTAAERRAQCRWDLVHAAGCALRGKQPCAWVEALQYIEPGDHEPGTRIPRSLRKYFGGRARV